MKTTSCIMFFLMLAWTQHATSQDWNLWRGPNNNGSIAAPGYFPSDAFALQTVWSKRLGQAYSTVSVAHGRVLTMFNDGPSDFLASFDLESGDENWRYRIGRIYKAHDGGHDGPVSTPVADEERVYGLSPRGRLFAVSAETGNEVWSVDARKKYHAQTPFWGFASTPVIFEHVLVVQIGGRGDAGLVAVDKQTGTELWRVPCGQVDYRSPILARIEGVPQIVFSDSQHTKGIDPMTGETKWRYAKGISNDKTPLYLGDRKLLLVRGGCELIELDEDLRNARRLWRSSEMRGNYDVPVCHDQFIYGFTDQYLTCIDAKTGKRTWRSRPPGGKALILVDEHLIVFGDHGDVVVVEANPRRYVEKARLNVSDGAAYSGPAFSQDTIVVRNLKHLVALKPAKKSAFTSVAKSPASQFEKLLNSIADAPDKAESIDNFIKSQASLPVIEDEKFVHFIYQGAAKDVGISGTMLASGEQDPLNRIEGTNYFWRSYPIEPGANWEYQFIIDYDRTIPDPQNPLRALADASRSELRTPSWTEPDFAKPWNGSAGGQLKRIRLESETSQMSANATVYLPHQYQNQSRHPLVVVLGGGGWLKNAELETVLNHLFTDTGDAPPVIAFVDRSAGATLGGWRTESFAKVLRNEFVPQLISKYRILDTPDALSIAGMRGGAVAAVYTALRYPAYFGRCLAISYGRADTERADMIEALLDSDAEHKPAFHVAWNRYDVWRPQSFSCREQSRELSERLRDSGYRITGGEDPTGSGWRSWKAQFGYAIQSLVD